MVCDRLVTVWQYRLMVLLRGSGERGRCSTHGLPLWVRSNGLLGEVSGSSSQFLASEQHPEPRLSCTFSEHTRPEEVEGLTGARKDLSLQCHSLLPQELHTPLGPLFTSPFPCSMMPSAWPLGCSSAQSTGISFPLGHLPFPLGRNSGNASVSEMKGPILCCQPQERQRISSPCFGLCRDDSGWTGTGQVPSGCH